jgi:hypothetical protein
MCPACITAATWWVVGGASAGGVFTVALTRWRQPALNLKPDQRTGEKQPGSKEYSLQRGDEHE